MKWTATVIALMLMLGLDGCTTATRVSTPIGVSLETTPKGAPPPPPGDRETALRQQHQPEAGAGRVANAAYCDAIEGVGYRERHATHQRYCQRPPADFSPSEAGPPPAAAPPAAPCPCPECPAAVPPATAPPAIPPAVSAAEGGQRPPYVGGPSGDVHLGEGVNLTALANAEAARLWREAAAWADQWTDAEQCRDALAEVHYALGAGRLRGFGRMLGELESRDWDQVGYELLQSEWARVVGARAERIASTLKRDCAGAGE